MSVVTSIILHLCEDEDLSVLDRINSIITERGGHPLLRVDQFMSRQKNSLRMVFGGTYNYVDSTAIVQAFIAHSFEFPDYGMLVVDDEHDHSHRLYLAKGADVAVRKQVWELSKWVNDLQAEMTANTDKAEIARLRQWVNDLQSGMTVNCVYCGHRYGPDPGTPVAMSDVLKAHIVECPDHPLAKLLTAVSDVIGEWKHGFDPDRLTYALRRLDETVTAIKGDAT